MRKTITTFILLIVIIVLNVNAQNTDTLPHGFIVKIGDIAPDFETILHDSSTFKLSDNRGKVVMLQFTASWCGVCRKEMPFIENEIWQKFKNNDFVLFGIDRDEPLDKVIEFISQTKITYPLALDLNSKIFSQYALKNAGVTRNIIIDRNGKIIYLTRLFNRDEFDTMKKIIFDEIKKD